MLSVGIAEASKKPFIFCNDKVRYLNLTAKMNLKEFSEFFHFFRSDTKIYSIGYNILVGYDVYTISDIIEVIGMGNGRAQSQLCYAKYYFG